MIFLSPNPSADATAAFGRHPLIRRRLWRQFIFAWGRWVSSCRRKPQNRCTCLASSRSWRTGALSTTARRAVEHTPDCRKRRHAVQLRMGSWLTAARACALISFSPVVLFFLRLTLNRTRIVVRDEQQWAAFVFAALCISTSVSRYQELPFVARYLDAN